jgi:hypothetical protein
MKKSFSLIELIFTIVIIGLIFTVIPKIMYVTSQSFDFTLKEDGLFNMMAKAMDISVMETDENNTISDDILFGGNNNILECNATTDIRIGGFYGGRDCKHDKYLSHIGVDDGENDESDYDDVDDFNSTESNSTLSNGKTKYIIYVFVGYSDDNFSYDYDNHSLDFNFSKRQNDTPSNIKRTYLVLNYRFKGQDKNISSFQYFSANIGHMYIEDRQW